MTATPSISGPATWMRRLACVAILASPGPLIAADDAKPAADPFAGAFFSPELVFLSRDRIAMTREQQGVFRACVANLQSRSNDLRMRLDRESGVLAALAHQERVDGAALDAQLDKVLDAERELKHLHAGMLAAIKNLLTPEQQAKLRGIERAGVAPLVEEARQRLSGKLGQVEAGMRRWAGSGRDPSPIAKAMEVTFKPLIDAGKVVEAEAELDRILEQLGRDAQ